MQQEINLMEHPHEECHQRVAEALDRIQTGETAVVIADHDTKPVFYMYEAQHGYSLDCEYLDSGPDVWKVRVTKGPKLEERPELDVFDVRTMPPTERHSSILAMFDALLPGDGFVLVNDHDPKPMYYQLRSIRGQGFNWTYLQQGPAEWRIQIVKTDEPVVAEAAASVTLDIRAIPHAERHHTIFHSLSILPDNEPMELIVDHDPLPLRHAVQQRYGGRVTWEYEERGPDVWRVLQKNKVPVARPTPTEAPDLDVRSYPPAQRHTAIFETYDALKPGEAFVLVNDHDPKPLYYQFEAEMPGRFRWEYLQSGPDEWRVLLGKAS